MERPEELVKKVTHLVSLPEIYLRIKQVIERPNSTLKEIAQLVEKDPGIAAKVLGLANSAFYGFATRIETVSRAVNILGSAQLHDLVLGTSVIRAFHGIPGELIDMQAFWRNSFRCALVAKGLAEKCKVLDTERVFLQGLLHDIGHLVLCMMLPERAREVLEAAEKQGEPVFKVERRLLGFHYGEVGGALLRAWKLPVSLQETTTFHIEPSQAREFPFETAIIHLAWALTLAETYRDDKIGLIPAVDPLAWEQTGLAEEDAERVLDQAAQSLQESLSLFMPSSPNRAVKR